MPKPLEFKIEDGDVYFIEGEMQYFTHYGRLFTAVPTATENQYETKKFDTEQQEYIHTNELLTFEMYSTTWEVQDGYFTAVPPIPEPEPTADPTNTDIMAKLLEQEESTLNRDELLLEQQLLLLNIDLNTSI